MTTEKKMPSPGSEEERAFLEKAQQKLWDRIAYHERKLEEEKAAREAQSRSDR
jgi:hypothetical protein